VIAPRKPAPLHDPRPLTPRMVEAMDLMCQGLTNEEIGARLFLAPFTVRDLLRQCYQRLGVEKRATAAVAWSRRRALYRSAVGDITPETRQPTRGVVTLILCCYECRRGWVERVAGETERDACAYLKRLGGGCVYCGYPVVSERMVEEFSAVGEPARMP